MNYYLLILFLLGLFFWLYNRNKVKYSHKWRRKSSAKLLLKIQNMEAPQIFAYLRKTDPFIVEELILDSIEKRGDTKIIRNKKYTGDKGIDGIFYYKLSENNKAYTRKYIIQVKRYKTYINANHIEEFKQHIKREKAYKGLFIHTGKTGKNSYLRAKEDKNLEIISGERLILLLKQSKFSFCMS